ncbi:MAG: hypothetical protein QW101_04835 [Ignisphaera sp.]|uniref:Uncharacterized protein n=1 Tax=Ignisphaera aggregans TaxID=334771 RepID=A0A7J3N084_9CREN
MKLELIVKHTIEGLKKVFNIYGRTTESATRLQEKYEQDDNYEETHIVNRNSTIRCVFELNQIICYDTVTGKVY